MKWNKWIELDKKGEEIEGDERERTEPNPGEDGATGKRGITFLLSFRFFSHDDDHHLLKRKLTSIYKKLQELIDVLLLLRLTAETAQSSGYQTVK